ncbi:hypothetical protein [Enterococcus termitis]|uniref:Uncharacterized protein n=1 Tax=Enterococcus termitis TaxID=332950 RepID=A0A1E5GHS7_9ENTE|nr:hypothetical protein [Enterococcus termitis]OEG12239.1 hypothetical protein BCR25_06750 [Enterococcus termitis]OJG98951.1 hypothetical protein RV18_GL002813 [Enterococcus termitis]
MKKSSYWIIVLALSFLLVLVSTEYVNAQRYVEDDLESLEESTFEYVSKLNSEKFSALEGSPELGIALTTDVEPAGNRLDYHIDNEFRNFDFQNRTNPNNILVIFTLAKGDLTIAHSEEIQSFVAPLNEDIEMKKRIWRLIQEEKYDEAVIDISNYIYTNVEQAVNEKGWAKIYEDSALARQEEQRLREKKRNTYIFIAVSIGVFSIAVSFFYRQFISNKAKRHFYSHKILPKKLERDESFCQKEFDHWLKNRQKIYLFYKTEYEATRAMKHYFIHEFLPVKLAQFKAIKEEHKHLLMRSLNNQAISAYFIEHYFSEDKFSFISFTEILVEANDVSKAYCENLLSKLSTEISDFSLEEELLEDKWPMIPEYKQELYKITKEKIFCNHTNAEYLERYLLDGLSYEQMLDDLSNDIGAVIMDSLKTALFTVDLNEVYKLELLYKEIIENDFSDEDLAEVMQALKVGYRGNKTTILKLKSVAKTAIIERQDIIKDRNRGEKTILRVDFREREVKTLFRPKSK